MSAAKPSAIHAPGKRTRHDCEEEDVRTRMLHARSPPAAQFPRGRTYHMVRLASTFLPLGYPNGTLKAGEQESQAFPALFRQHRKRVGEGLSGGLGAQNPARR